MRFTKNDTLIELTLANMRDAIKANRYNFIGRTKNKDTLARLGINYSQAVKEMEELTAKNYISGPDPDRDYPEREPLWKFKKQISGSIVYIKFKIRYDDAGLVIISFHFDEIE